MKDELQGNQGSESQKSSPVGHLLFMQLALHLLLFLEFARLFLTELLGPTEVILHLLHLRIKATPKVSLVMLANMGN